MVGLISVMALFPFQLSHKFGLFLVSYFAGMVHTSNWPDLLMAVRAFQSSGCLQSSLEYAAPAQLENAKRAEWILAHAEDFQAIHARYLKPM